MQTRHAQDYEPHTPEASQEDKALINCDVRCEHHSHHVPFGFVRELVSIVKFGMEVTSHV